MRVFIIFIVLYVSAISNAMTDATFLKKNLEKTPILKPFHILKNTAEKISSLGLKKLFYGFTAAAFISEAYKSFNQDKYITSDIKNKSFQRIKSKGQVYVNNIDQNEARRRALEDALYYATIKGGAKVDGFSSIKNDTSLEEHFTVRPKSQILDYRILKSYMDEDIYIVEIEAIVGSLDNHSQVCTNDKPITVNEFKGNHSVITNVPGEYHKLGVNIINLVGNYLSNKENISYINNKNYFYNFNKSNFDLSYDYKTLVTGAQNANYGDFVYIPSIKLSKSKVYPITYLVKNNELPEVKNPSYFFDTDVLKIDIDIEIYNGISNTKVSSISEKYLIPLNLDSNFEYIELFTKNDREYVHSEIENIALDITNTINKNLICLPLTANINYVNNKLIVPLGKKNGIRKNQLAVLENNVNDTSFTFLSVSSLTNNSATLTPLNANVRLDTLSGKKTRFLE